MDKSDAFLGTSSLHLIGPLPKFKKVTYEFFKVKLDLKKVYLKVIYKRKEAHFSVFNFSFRTEEEVVEPMHSFEKQKISNGWTGQILSFGELPKGAVLVLEANSIRNREDHQSLFDIKIGQISLLEDI